MNTFEAAGVVTASMEKLAELHSTMRGRLDAHLTEYRWSDLVREAVLRLDDAGRKRVSLRTWESVDDRTEGASLGVVTLPLKWLAEEVLARRPEGMEELTRSAFDDIWFCATNVFHSRRLLSHAESGLELADVDLQRALSGEVTVLECIDSCHPLDVDLDAFGRAMSSQWDDARLDASDRLANYAMGDNDAQFDAVSVALLESLGFSLRTYFGAARVLGNLPSVCTLSQGELVQLVASRVRVRRPEAEALCRWLTIDTAGRSGGAESSARDGRLLIRPLIALGEDPHATALLVSPGMVLEAAQYMFQQLACGFFALPNELVPPPLRAALGQLHQHLTSLDEARVAGVLGGWGWSALASVERCAELGTREKLSVGEIDVIAVDAESRSIYVLELKDARSAHDGRTVRSQLLNRASYEGQLTRKCAYASRHADEIAGHLLGVPLSRQGAGGWTVRGCFVVSVAAAWQYVVDREERAAVLLESELSPQSLRSLPAFSIPVDA